MQKVKTITFARQRSSFFSAHLGYYDDFFYRAISWTIFKSV